MVSLSVSAGCVGVTVVAAIFTFIDICKIERNMQISVSNLFTCHKKSSSCDTLGKLFQQSKEVFRDSSNSQNWSVM